MKKYIAKIFNGSGVEIYSDIILTKNTTSALDLMLKEFKTVLQKNDRITIDNFFDNEHEEIII